MNCNWWRSNLMELARARPSGRRERGPVAAHLSACAECRLFLEQQMALTSALSELAAETAPAPPAAVESMVLAEFNATRLLRRRHLKVAAAAGAIAAALAGTAVFQSVHSKPSYPATQPSQVIASTVAVKPVVRAALDRVSPKAVHRRHPPRSPGAPASFVAIPYTVPLDPREQATILRMEMPVAALAAVGLPVEAPDPGATAQADVLVGEDGRIHAIRLVALSSPAYPGSRSSGSDRVNSNRSIQR